MEVSLSRSAVVIRFRPTELSSVLASGEKAQRVSGRFVLSVFADTVREGESTNDVLIRLIKVAGLSGLSLDRNPKFYVCTSAGTLLDEGFTFHKDGDPDELEEHYSVYLGSNPTLPDVARFLAAFSKGTVSEA